MSNLAKLMAEADPVTPRDHITQNRGDEMTRGMPTPRRTQVIYRGYMPHATVHDASTTRCQSSALLRIRFSVFSVRAHG